MHIFSGKGACGGVAIGPIHIVKQKNRPVNCTRITEVSAEILRLEQAKDTAVKQLQSLRQKAMQKVGKEEAAIFEVHEMLLADEGYLQAIKEMICSQSVNAEYAVECISEKYGKMFSQMDNPYMRERAADIKDVSGRLIRLLQGVDEAEEIWEKPAILVAEDLTPSQTLQLDKEKVLAFVTVKGSYISHTAILARTMGIPALVGVNLSLEALEEATKAIVDAEDGMLYVQPDETLLQQMREKREAQTRKNEQLKTLKGAETVTRDGRKIGLYANIGGLSDLPAVIENGGEGIGLFRTEFLYLERKDFPTEEEQFQTYKQVAEAMCGKEVIIRTMDLGADKQCDYLIVEEDEKINPEFRGIRISLARPEVFRTQLRAIFRAAALGNIAVMYPMVMSVSEVEQIQEIVKSVKKELDEQGITYGNPKQGIMIETPAAVSLSDELAKQVDFFSIGSNDLTQYTLKIDRRNSELDVFCDKHPAIILDMIETVVKNGHKAGIKVGICGELAADTTLTKIFVEMGVDELSVPASKILSIRKTIREI